MNTKTRHLILQPVIDDIKKYHYVDDSNIKELISAFDMLSDCLKEENTNTDNVINDKLEHSLSVARYIASYRLGIPVVIAALLHEIPINHIKSLEEIRLLINEEAYTVLRGYFDIHKQISEFGEKNLSDVKGTNNFYLNTPYPESFYIEIANHVDILSRNINNSKKAIDFAQKTRELLIPQVKYISAYKMVDILEELCFQIENEKVYQDILRSIKKVDNLNELYRQKFIKKLNHIFDPNSNITPPELKKFQSCVSIFNINKRSIVSIYRFITQNDSEFHSNTTLKGDLKKLDNFCRTAYYDLILVLDDEELSKQGYDKIDIFMEYFKSMLQPEGVFIYGCYYTTNKDSYYFLISDPMKNMYRFFVRTKSEHLHYLYGDIISRDKFDLNYLSKKNDEEIKVFRKDGTAEMVEKGITVLDFAFKIHEDLGLRFESAILNRNDRLLPAHTVLNNGDTIEIKKSQSITADLNWFRYLKTDLAVNYLIKHFKTQHKKSSYNIRVTTSDGEVKFLDEGATVLDFAFTISKDTGLCFDYALVNDSPQHLSIDYVPCNDDIITIHCAQTVRADYYWFKHARLAETIDQLIEYFENTRNV